MNSIRIFFLTTACMISAAAAEPTPKQDGRPMPAFRFEHVTDKSLALSEGDRPVFVYNYGTMSKSGVPADRNRSSYIHPLYGLDGEVLTDDFPEDHYHHRGLFWAWPRVKIGNASSDLWMLKGIEQRFESWVERQANERGAKLVVENGWHLDGRKVVRERVSFRVRAATEVARAIDVELELVPLTEPLTLQGAEGKSYGGLTLRFAPRAETRITIPAGPTETDLPMARLPWADLSGRFSGNSRSSGVTIFVHPDHPDFPPEWLTRHYGVLCLGWPGVQAQTFQRGTVIRCQYRLWIHRNDVGAEQIKTAYERYVGSRALSLD